MHATDRQLVEFVATHLAADEQRARADGDVQALRRVDAQRVLFRLAVGSLVPAFGQGGESQPLARNLLLELARCWQEQPST